ncbi:MULTISPECIES: ParB/RepB/Spo0J family partition protein [Cupriavidus]|jgi:ParB family transcriptional regulator, chromosome partitioning protein|uniref:ParB/RepB/Spo0J family partition protein n=1 Tax=Cupriavidus TaxID=106589 RepID=UPI000464BEC4|nr:ParB/RepB/Spo0J family partition protein [Cupriavidus metallidurans]KWW32378.1 Chromosome-partitioning protein Spo0J [Cupriavidus metallidurans]
MITKKSSALEKLSRRAAPVADDDAKTFPISLDKIRFDAAQPRQAFHHPDGQVAQDDESAIDEMAQSIEGQGLIQPITVAPIGDGTYRVLVGERRTRAHLKLGRATILARIRDDLTDPKKRLIFQLAENVNRMDLTDADMARSIRRLMEGADGVEALTQTQIAKALGKSEGWVSRYVKFGDDELQRLWVQTGIADTVEKLYRLSILPMPVQAEIQRRVQLPQDDPEYLAKPLLRSVIDDLARDAKAAKRAPVATVAPPRNVEELSAPTQPEQRPGPADVAPGDGVPNDPVARAFAEMAEHGRTLDSQQNANAQKPAPASTIGSAYKLPEGDRAKILNAVSVTLEKSEKAAAQPPVSVRVPVASLQALLQKLEPADQEALAGMQLSINLPGPLAERIANVLTGVMWDASEVPAVVQNELAKLQ